MLNYKNDTTWQPTWKHGKTQTIRVPIALVPKILEYARALDSLHVIDTVLGAIDEYIELRCQQGHHPNQHSRETNINARTWDELRRFRSLVEKGGLS
ncbi:MAG: hypothetical protein ACR2LR_03290 [Hassallia sp.]